MTTQPQKTLRARLLSGGAWILAGKLANVGSRLIISAILARLLAPDAMGAYFLVLSLVTAGATFSQLGMNLGVVRFVAESRARGDSGRARRAVHLALSVVLATAVVFVVVLFAGLWRWFGNDAFDVPQIVDVRDPALFWLVVFALQIVLAETFRGFQMLKLAALFDRAFGSMLAAVAFAAIWVLRGSTDLYEVIVLSAAAGLTSSAVGSLLVWRTTARTVGQWPVRM